jgi:CRP-like cAMP-binding protein
VANPADLIDVPLFAGLDDGERAELAKWFEERTVGAGVRLCGEGIPGYSFFVLVDGSADVASADQALGRLGPGDFFGEVAILGDGRRTATVTTTAPSKLLTMFGTEFRRLQSAQPAIAEAIVETMQARVVADGPSEREPV